MRIDPTVRKETLRIAAGTVILSALMVSVFLIVGEFNWTVLTGALWGTCFAILNFFLLGLSVQAASAKMNGVHLPPKETDPETCEEVDAPLSEEALAAKKGMQLAYSGRMLLTLIAAALAIALPCFHPIAGVLPLLFPRIVIFILGALGKVGN